MCGTAGSGNTNHSGVSPSWRVAQLVCGAAVQQRIQTAVRATPGGNRNVWKNLDIVRFQMLNVSGRLPMALSRFTGHQPCAKRIWRRCRYAGASGG
jgi:hypothetical protein